MNSEMAYLRLGGEISSSDVITHKGYSHHPFPRKFSAKKRPVNEIDFAWHSST